MHFNVYCEFHSQCSHQRVSAGIPVIFRVILLLLLLLQNTIHTNVNYVTVIP